MYRCIFQQNLFIDPRSKILDLDLTPHHIRSELILMGSCNYAESAVNEAAVRTLIIPDICIYVNSQCSGY